MLPRLKTQLALLIALSLVVAACTSSDDPDQAEATQATTAVSAEPEVTTSPDPAADSDSETETSVNSITSDARVEVALVFSYHEPYLPPIDGALELSRSRLSAARNYLDVPQLLEEFPTASASIAISAPTILQLESLVNRRGLQRTVDRHYLVTNKLPSDLTPDERQFILNNFFEGPAEAFETYERWDELRERRDAGSTLTDADLGDITVYFHLAQLDPELVIANENLSSLKDRSGSFTLEDARQVLQAIDNQIDRISGSYTDLYETDRLEVITSTGALPNADPVRAATDVTVALGVAADFVDKAPKGITITGDVADESDLEAMADGGAQWILSMNSNGQAPTTAPASVADGALKIVASDPTLARLIAEDYSELSAAEATEDFLGRLGAIADQQGTDEAPLVTVVIDAANTFASYENDGSTFLRTLVNALTTSEDFAMTTPSRYITQHASTIVPVPEIDAVFSSDVSSWQGEPEEDAAAALITEARTALDELVSEGDLQDSVVQDAERLIRNAEVSEFGFYFGQDHDSGQDDVFDRGFRQWLRSAYEAVGAEVSESIDTPIVAPQLVVPINVASGAVAINIDGNPSDWAEATLFDFADTNDVVAQFGVAVDGEALALRFDGGIESEVQLYLSIPRNEPDRTTTISGDTLGFGATHMIIWTDTEGACLAEILPPEGQFNTLPTGCVLIPSGLSEAGVELKVPSELVGGLSEGDVISVRIKTGSSLGPIAGPIVAEIPADSP